MTPVAIVAAPLANKPGQGGAAWVPVTWALALRRLGFEVWLVEELSSQVCADGAMNPVAVEASENLAFFQRVMSYFALNGALIVDGGAAVYGATLDGLRALASNARLLINISGHLSWPAMFEEIALRVFLDLDPGFTQFWAQEGLPVRLEGHHAHYTIGENVGRPGCRIPTGPIAWRTTRNPVLLDLWPPSRSAAGRFTTVASWRGPYGPVQADGERLGLKAHEFRRYVELPRLAEGEWELALDIDPADDADRQRLLAEGWRLVDPRSVAGDPGRFAAYVRDSRAEFSVAQEMYVRTRSGWFSDRTTRYLASGRPALVQDTGFSDNLPVGMGLLTFRDPDEAVEGARLLGRDYDAHARAARAVAERYFDSDTVLGQMLEELGVSP